VRRLGELGLAVVGRWVPTVLGSSMGGPLV
jgi:hypothetical protein